MNAPITERRISAGSPSLRGNERQYVNDVLQRDWLTMGYYVKEFEAAFAAYIGVKHAISVSNGTAALHLALLAAGIGAGDEVITPATTFIATANAVTYCGAKAVIADVDPDTWCINPREVEKAITKRTRAILPVHLYGSPCDMGALMVLAINYGLKVIEDAAEAIGAELTGNRVGSMGDLGCFSFYGNKTITTGEGGMITTDDDALAQKIRLLRGQGQVPGLRYVHDRVGYNYRMTDLQAAVGLAQLEQIDDILTRRRAVIEAYREACDETHWVSQQAPLYSVHGAWAFALLLPDGCNATFVAERLEQRGIETRPVFPPIHTQLPYLTNQRLPVAERIAERGLVLPTHSELTPADARYVIDVLKEVIGG